MKKSSNLFITFLSIVLLIEQGIASEVTFITQPKDLLFQQTYCWQPGNLYRPILSLDGEWEYNTGEKDLYKKVTLPASCDYWGKITFRKSFVPDSVFTDHLFRLVCYGINYYCMIYVNDKFIGSHSGGYSSFAFDIPAGLILINQKNSIEIKVDTRLDSKKTIPHQLQPDGVKNTAGIFRSIYLTGIPELSIEAVTYDYQFTQDLSQCQLEINFELNDRIDNSLDQGHQQGKLGILQYYIELYAKLDERPVLQEMKEVDVPIDAITKTISTKLTLKQPRLWSPESPFLYSLRIQLIRSSQIIDQFDQSLGIKQLDFREGNIYLNGTRLILKGVNWVENYLVNGALFDRNQLVQDLELVKQLHANAIRVLHHPAHPALASLCDSLGLFLLEEIPLNWVPTSRLASENFIEYSSDYIYETVNRDRAHVSVFAWGIGGHFLLSDSLSENFIKQVTERASDLTRHPFYIWNSPPPDNKENDPNLINGISLLNLKKEQIQNELLKWIRKNSRHINLVLSYGAPQLGISPDSDNNALFEEYQVLQIVDAWRAITSHPEIDGYFISTLSDYQGNYPTTMFRNCIDTDLRPFGLTNYNRKKRMAFETIRSLYHEGKSRYNPGVDMKDELPATFLIIGLGTILVFLFMVNNRRYFQENLKRIFVHPHGFYVDIRDGRKIPPSHTIFMALFISIGCGLTLASILSFFKYQSHIDHLITILLQTSDLKNQFCHLCWNSGLSVLFYTLFSLFLFFLMALYFKFIALVTRKRCSILQSLTIPFWFGGNFIVLIPLGMVLFRLFQYEKIIIPTFLFLLIIKVWFLFRIVKGMRVMFIWSIHRAFIVVIVTIFLVIAGILYYYQTHYALIDYLTFYYQIYGAQIFSVQLP